VKGRALEIARAAYLLIAEKGLEGFRTRDVADRVGINSATLHYYFPNKESLIRAVVEYLMNELRTSRVPSADSGPAVQRLRAEFEDIRRRLRESPEQLVVLTELAVRSSRDPAIARLLEYLDLGWRTHLTSIINAGVNEGTFRPDLNVEACAVTLMSQLRGLGYCGHMETVRIEQILDEIAAQVELRMTGPSEKMPSLSKAARGRRVNTTPRPSPLR
jgi:AcrR family transcriptional regulator